MKTRTILAYSLIMNAFVLSAASCSDDSEEPSGSAGKGGSSSGRGGEAGQAGQPGGAGAGAEGGMSAGTGGSGTGGSGTGGTGTGGSGTGGAGTGGASTGGTSGTGSGGEEAGRGGEGGDGAGGDSTEGARSCQVGCQSEDDCASSTPGDLRRCDLTSMRCVECTAHADCVPIASAWSATCDDDTGCFWEFGEVCVNVGGSGRCALTPDSVVGCFPGEVPLTYPKFGVSTPEMVDVCGKESGRCENNLCFTGCTDDANFCTTGLNAGNGDTCDEASGRCTCAGDGECSQGPGHCNTTTHRCDECAGPADCAGAPEGKDACVNGRCGCSGASVCPTATFPAGTPVCE